MTCCRTLRLFLLAGMQFLRGPLGTSAAESPCPDVFHYEGSPGSEYGIITVPNPYPYLAIDITVAIYVTAPVPSGSPTKLEPVDRDMWRKLAAGSRDPVLYRLDFPVSSPLPTIESIVVNQNVICRGTKPNAEYLTTITVNKCNSASLECSFNIRQSPETMPQPPPPLPPSQNIGTDTNTRCGFPVVRKNPLIIIEQSTTHGQWPWHAALYRHNGYSTVYRCGGSFVGTRTIITAAHCVTTRKGKQLSPRDFIVFLGRYDLRNQNEEGIQLKDVHTIFIHSEYNYTYLKSDLAMLLLNSSVEFTAHVRPVCLWKPSDTSIQSIIGEDGVVVGLGLDVYGESSDNLKVVRMPVVAQDTCIRSHINFFSRFTHETTFCAGFRNGNSVCNGDSGGGMVFPEVQRDGSQIWKLRGIVSNSMPNYNDKTRCNTKSYVVFTDIAQYLEWISLHLI